MNRKSYISGTQEGIYIESINNPNSTVYNLPVLYKIPDSIDCAKLADCFNRAAEFNKGFSTRLMAADDGKVIQYIADNPPQVKTERISYSEFEKIRENLVRPFDLFHDELVRAVIYLTECGSWFFMDVHHIIYDGFSAVVFAKQMRALYDGKELEANAADGIDVAQIEESILKTERCAEAKKFFESLLDDCECDILPLNDIESKVPSQKQISMECDISIEKMDTFCKENGISKTVFFTAVMGFVAAKYACIDKSSIATVFNGRNLPEYKNAVTMMVKTLPFVTELDKHQTVKELLLSAAVQLKKSREYSFYPFTNIAADTGAGSDILFAYQGKILDHTLIDGIKMENTRIYDSANISETKIEAELLENDKGTFELIINFRADLYSAAFIKTFERAFVKASHEFLIKNNISDISILSAEDEADIRRFNKTEKQVDLDKTVVKMFSECAGKNPSNTAVVYKGKSLTYSQVDALSDRVAAFIVNKGLKAEDVVAILVPRSEYIAILPLATAKAGCAYQPLDPSYPKERLSFMVEDSQAKLLIADRGLRDVLDGYTGEVLFVDEIEKLPTCSAVLPEAKPKDLFTLLYTSGSTGVPKGCMLEFGNITAFCNWFGEFYGINNKSRYAAYASFGFDASMMDTFGTLTNGGELHILAEDIRLDFVAIADYFEENGITHTFMTTQIGRQFAMNMSPSGLKCLSTGGEKLVPCDPPKEYHFYNLYGPTECTILTTYFCVDKFYHNIPIGRPLDNFKLYVTDKWGNMLPPGACGELMISGYQVSRGYLNRPEKTAEVYTKNPFDSQKGYETIYHSGDVVRYMSDGNIQIIGRQDGQVKVRGFRIELTEIEEVIRRFEGIKDATVAAFEDADGGKYVAAYVVADFEVDIDALHAFIAEEKPPYMVPAVTMQIDAIPVNQNQKVNKKALPVPERKMEELILPQNDTQQKIYDILAEILNHKEFGITTNIYFAGITSITAVRLNMLLSKCFDRPIKTSDLKEHDTIEKLEKLLSQEIAEEKFELQEFYPLTKTQEGIFVECIAHPNSTIYNIPVLLKISERIEKEKLICAITDAINAHPFVMCTLHMDTDGDIFFRRDDSVVFSDAEVGVYDFTDKEEMLQSLAKPFELMDARLFKISVNHTKHDGTYLYMDFHHIISDGTSMLILLEDITRSYMGETLDKEVFSGYEAALLEKTARESDLYVKAKAYYDKIFEGCDAACMPQGNVQGEIASNDSTNYYSRNLKTTAVKDYCEKNKVTANGFFTAAFGIALSKFTGKEQAVFTTIYNGRSDTRLANTMSMFVKTYPVLCDVSQKNMEIKPSQYIKNIADQLENSMANDIYSFAEISRSYGINADVMFAYQGEDFGFDSLCGEVCELEEIKLDNVKAPLNVNVFLEGDKIRFFCEYRSDRFDEEYINVFLASFEACVISLMNTEKIKDVSVLSDAERAVLDKLNSTDGTAYDRYISLPEMLDAEIEKHPEKIAVCADGKSITYKELGQRSNSVGNGLFEMGVKADEPVALMLHRTIDVYPVRQGILKSGGAFLSIEPDYPDDRILYILKNANVRILVTTEDVYNSRKALIDESKVKVVFAEDLYKYHCDKRPDVEIKPEHLAYCIFTSGSTGNPKGVMIEHRNLLNFIDHHENNNITHYYLDNTKVMLALAAITFDVSVLEEFIPLYYGKTVVMATKEEIHNPILLAETMLKTGVDVMKCTPSYIQNILDIEPVKKAFRNLKAICIGAEPFPQGLYAKMREAGINGRIYNSYGPSETTVTVTIDDMTEEKIAIGKPIGNTKVFVLDSFGNVLPRYAPGEITICGKSVGRGYIGMLEATKEKFILLDGLNAYKSGDIGYWNGDGKIECKGRKDNQIKLRGLRIELDEIEKAMNTFDGIERSVVLVKENESGQYLCGYYSGIEVSAESLTAHLKTKLTEYMIPGVFVYVEKFPMTGNGKVDKKNLPEPAAKVAERNGREAENELEKMFCEMFSKVLGMKKIYADDDFFVLGGTSLSASKIAMQCMMKNISVSYSDVFEYTTPEKLAQYVGSSAGDAASPNVKPIEKKATDERAVLSHNKSEYASEVTYTPINNVLLSGSTGFLGVHVLRELLESNSEKIYCLVRRGNMTSAEKRLKTMLMYYFDSDYQEEFDCGRLRVIEADITDDNLIEKLNGLDFETIINCAAIVKHFAVGDAIEKVNVLGVKNLIEVAKAYHAKMIQISTVSVAGESVNDSVPKGKVIQESELFFGQNLDNRYVNTKFRAEEAMLEAIEGGMQGKIIRVGNLMSRNKDGEFQINYMTNGFMNRLRAYSALEKFPVGSSDSPVEFSPIDYVAKAVVLLSGTNDEFTVFHAYNCHHIHMANVISVMNEKGLHIDVVDDKEYTEYFNVQLSDEKMNMKISSLISYNSSDGGQHRFIGSDNAFTIKVLYRLGFAWPLIDENYVERAIEALSTLDFFD